MRTPEELADWLKSRAAESIFRFEREALMPFLTSAMLDRAGELKAGLSAEIRAELDAHVIPMTFEAVEKMAREYMAEFGWSKAEDHRGLSAGRTLDKMTAWLYALGRDDVIEAMDRADYAQYGAPRLKVICEAMGWPIPDSPVLAAMMLGKVCPNCREGITGGCGE